MVEQYSYLTLVDIVYYNSFDNVVFVDNVVLKRYGLLLDKMDLLYCLNTASDHYITITTYLIFLKLLSDFFKVFI